MRLSALVRLLVYTALWVGYSPLIRVLNPFATLYLALTSLLGVQWDIQKSHPARRFLLNLLAIAAFFFTLTRLSLEDFLTPMVYYLVFVSGLKLLQPKGIRDYFQILLLGILMLFISAAYLIDPSFLVAFVLELWLGVLTPVFLNFYRETGDTRLSGRTVHRIIGSATLIPITSAPFIAALFFLLPRTSNSLFLNIHRNAALTGLADRVELGQTEALQQDPTTAARVIIEGGPLRPDQLYWRAFVFDYFDGKAWRRSKAYETRAITSSGQVFFKVRTYTAHRVRYTVLLEPTAIPMLLTLDKPVVLNYEGPIRIYPDLTITPLRSTLRRLRYRGVSAPARLTYREADQPDPALYLQLPDSLPPQLVQLARNLAQGRRSPLEIARTFERYFRETFTYTLDFQPPPGENPLAVFLEVRRGFCEYFSSAMALGLRILGIPARVVGGYLGGEWNEYGHYYQIRYRNAHTWVEAYIPDQGWMRFDPSPPSLESLFPKKRSRLALWLDYLRLRWYTYVINYNLDQQMGFLLNLSRRLGNIGNFSLKEWRWPKFMPETSSSPFHSLPLWVLLLLAAGLGGILWRTRHTSDPAVSIYTAACHLLSRKGLERLPSEGPLTFYGRVARHLPSAPSQAFRQITEAFVRHAYGGHKLSSQEIRELREALRRLKKTL